ncbi:MAG: hypothetical protein WBA74_03550 [Cyclobacteriaceae bacterium]
MIRYLAGLVLLASTSMLFSCTSEMDEYVESINLKAKEIDNNRRVEIKEDDYHEGDTVYKIRGYYMDDVLLKLVGITRTSHMERDDYFYFDHQGNPLFTGHLVNKKDQHDAAEYKYYYKDESIIASMYWEDHYQPGKQFPHEQFEYFNPSIDSLLRIEEKRLSFFKMKLNEEGFEVQEENENLEANSAK